MLTFPGERKIKHEVSRPLRSQPGNKGGVRTGALRHSVRRPAGATGRCKVPVGSRGLWRAGEPVQGRGKGGTDQSIRHRSKSQSQNLQLGGTWELMGQQHMDWCGQNTAEATGTGKEIILERQGHSHRG